jgi:hypothetical protein
MNKIQNIFHIFSLHILTCAGIAQTSLGIRGTGWTLGMRGSSLSALVSFSVNGDISTS